MGQIGAACQTAPISYLRSRRPHLQRMQRDYDAERVVLQVRELRQHERVQLKLEGNGSDYAIRPSLETF